MDASKGYRLMLLVNQLAGFGVGGGATAVYSNLLPVLTSATGGGVTASDNGSYNSNSFPAWKASDGLLTGNSNAWLSTNNSTSGWIEFEFDSPVTVYAYAVYSGDFTTTGAPKDWTLKEGGVTVDTQTGQTGWGTQERREFTLGSPATGTVFRLDITDNNGFSLYVGVQELELLG
jgi:hypothetical protein